MLATEVTENTVVYSFVGAALAANNPSDCNEFAAKAAPTFTVIGIRTTKQAFPSLPLSQNIYRINPPDLMKAPIFYRPRLFSGTAL